MNKNKIKRMVKKFVTNAVVTAVVMTTGNVPALAAGIPTLQIDGMSNVASSLQNIIKYVGVFFMGGGALVAMNGAYKVFQSIKAQDSESRSSSILETAAGLGGVAVGVGGAFFSQYIHV